MFPVFEVLLAELDITIYVVLDGRPASELEVGHPVHADAIVALNAGYLSGAMAAAGRQNHHGQE